MLAQPLVTNGGDGLDPAHGSFPQGAIDRYRGYVILPFIIILLGLTSFPAFVLSLVFCDDECWAEVPWWERPTTVCAASNGVLMLLVPFTTFCVAKREGYWSHVLLACVAILQLIMKSLEMASIITTQHRCEYAWLFFVDVLLVSSVVVCGLMGLLAGARYQRGDKINVGAVFTNCIMGFKSGLLFWVLPCHIFYESSPREYLGNRCNVIFDLLPVLTLLLLSTSAPFLALGIVFWDDHCWSGSAWWYRPTTVSAVSNGIFIATVILGSCSLVRREGVVRLSFVGLQMAMKVVEVASIVATSIILSRWCNASLIAIADVIVGSTVTTVGFLGVVRVLRKNASSYHRNSYCRELSSGCVDGACRGALLVGAPAFAPFIGVAMVFCFPFVQVGGIVVSILAFVRDACNGSPWIDPRLALISTSIVSLIVMGVILVSVLFGIFDLDCHDCGCTPGMKFSCIMSLFVPVGLGAAWIMISLWLSGCQDVSVWWFGCMEVLAVLLAAIGWISGVTLVSCTRWWRRQCLSDLPDEIEEQSW